MAEAEIIQLGSRGRAGRGSRSTPSAAARGLSGSTSRRPGRVEVDGQPDLDNDPNRGPHEPTAEPRTPFIEDAFSEDRLSEEHGLGGANSGDLANDALAAEKLSRRADRPRKRPARTRGPARSTYPPPMESTAAPDLPMESPSAPDPATPSAPDPATPSAPDRATPSAPDRATPSAPDRATPSAPDPGTAGAADDREVPRGEESELGGALNLLMQSLGAGFEALRQLPFEQVRRFAADPLRGLMALAEAVGVDWEGGVDEIADFARSRLSGDYAIDEFGFDPEFTDKVFLPALRPMVEHWFRVEVRGIENLPTSGPALLVSNHAGTMPLDGMVMHSVVHDAIGRHVRMLGADLIFATPFSHDLARRIGTTLACQEDAERLLASGELVSVFPEGFKGLGKPYRDRYKLQRFGRGGFVSAAIRAQVPIIPISVVGSEEIYPLIASAPTLARALGAPYFPITPLFPWFGLLGMIPLPSKWIISFGEAIATDELPTGAAEDPMVVFNVTDQVRETIQHSLYALLMQRPHAFR